jgi:Trp operon repressor
MPFDISEIKKLSVEERLRIIDELWKSIDADREQEEPVVNEDAAVYGVDEDAEEESPEIIAILEEQIAKIERGEEKLYTEEEVKQILKKDIEEFRKSRNG